MRRRLRRPTGNKLQHDSTVVASDTSVAATSSAVDMETSASVNKFKVRNRIATRKSGTEISSEKHVSSKDSQDDGGYKVIF